MFFILKPILLFQVDGMISTSLNDKYKFQSSQKDESRNKQEIPQTACCQTTARLAAHRSYSNRRVSAVRAILLTLKVSVSIH